MSATHYAKFQNNPEETRVWRGCVAYLVLYIISDGLRFGFQVYLTLKPMPLPSIHTLLAEDSGS